MADGTGAPGHPDRLVPHRRVASVGEQAAVRGHRRHAEARTKLRGDAVGQLDRLPGRNHRPLRRRPPRPACRGQPGPHPLAGPARVDAVADRVDYARSVVVRDLEPVDRAGRGPAARLPVGRVDAGVLDLDPNLAGSWLRPVDVLDPQDFAARAMTVVHRSSHAYPVWTDCWIRVGPSPIIARRCRGQGASPMRSDRASGIGFPAASAAVPTAIALVTRNRLIADRRRQAGQIRIRPGSMEFDRGMHWGVRTCAVAYLPGWQAGP